MRVKVLLYCIHRVCCSFGGLCTAITVSKANTDVCAGYFGYQHVQKGENKSAPAQLAEIDVKIQVSTDIACCAASSLSIMQSLFWTKQ